MPHAHTWLSGEGRMKSSSKLTLTSMMTTSKSANKRDYDDKGTYDNLREGNRNILSSTSTLITTAARARTAVLASWRRPPGGGGRNHRLRLRQHRWWQLRIARTSGTTMTRVPMIICRLRSPTVWLIYGMEVKLIRPAKFPMMDNAKIMHWMKQTILLKKDVHSGKNLMKA